MQELIFLIQGSNDLLEMGKLFARGQKCCVVLDNKVGGVLIALLTNAMRKCFRTPQNYDLQLVQINEIHLSKY